MSLRLEPARTGRTSAPATISQQFFYGMWRDAPDPSAYYQTSPFVIDGELDAERFARVAADVIAEHEVFRTAFREEGGVLYQIVRPITDVPRFELELVDMSPADRETWGATIRHAAEEIAARGWDLDNARLVRGRLIKLAHDHHALVIVFHHIVIDAGSTFAFFRQLFGAYTGTGGETPALQYIDVADAQQRWMQNDSGREHAAFWQAQARGAVPIEIPTDRPRAPVDARRAAAWGGIATDPMYPVKYAPLPAELQEAVTTLARKRRVSIYGIYATALFWLLHERTGATDMCVETTADTRTDHPAFADVSGVLVYWTLLRANLDGCATISEALPRVGDAIAEVRKHGPFQDYYTHVPHSLRRIVMNYLPLRWVTPERRPLPGLRVEKLGQPFPRWRRPWDLHLTVMDGDQTVLAWTGNENLFEHETVEGLLARYIDILTAATRAE